MDPSERTDPAADGRVPTDARQPLPDAARRTYLLAATLATLALAGMTQLDLGVQPTVGWSIPVWLMAAITFGTAFMVFDVEFRSETYTFTFSEIVLVLGLFFASPVTLIAGRLAGEGAFLVGRQRQPFRKVALNLSVFFAETVMLLSVQQVLLDRLDVREPLSWLVALVAVVAAEMVGFASIAAVVRWHGGPITFVSIMRIGLITAPANTSLTLVIGVLLDRQPSAVPLLGGVALFLLMTYRAYSSLEQRFESLSLLYDFTHLVSGVREPDEVLDAMLTQAKDLLRTERAEFWLLSGSDSCRRYVVDDRGQSTSRIAVPPCLQQLLAEGFATVREAVLIARGTDAVHERRLLDELGAHDALLAPIVEGEALIGFVVAANRLSETSFVTQDARMFATLASHAGVALQNGRLIVRLHDQARQREHEALHDALTGLPNRVRFASQLEARFAAADVRPGGIAIALMDLDGFKDINDTLGHQSGDTVLIEVARRIQGATNPGTLVARLGGDEFALLAPPGATQADVETMCRRIQDSVAAAMEVDGIRATMGVSIGIATAPEDGHDVDTLIRHADIAMYAAKSGRGGGVCFYDAERDENTPRRLALAHELRLAVEGGQLRAVFQPKVSLTERRMTGVECLCRWTHPTLGEILPDEFIPLADRIGISGSLTTFMLETALRHAERWHAGGRDWSVAVNISMNTLLDFDMIEVVSRLVADTPVPADRITLEITETHVMSDAVRTTRALEELAALGVRLSIDDFGTGYSSLSYLQRLPVHEVKIDQSFVRQLATDPGADAIVRTVIDLARHLDLDVVAEGVEDAAAMRRLEDLGCREVQGFHLSTPVDADEAERVADRLERQLGGVLAPAR